MDKKPLSINNLNTHNNNRLFKKNGNGIQLPYIYGNPMVSNPTIQQVNTSFGEILETEKRKVEATHQSSSPNDDLIKRQMHETRPIEESNRVDDIFNLDLKDDFIISVTDFECIYGEGIDNLIAKHNNLLLKRGRISPSDPDFQNIIQEYDTLLKEVEEIVGCSFEQWCKEDTASFRVT